MDQKDFYNLFYKFQSQEKWYPLSRKKGAIVTQINNEDKFFPIWLKYYSQFYEPEDIYVLNHNSSGFFLEYLKTESQKGSFNLIPVHHNSWFSSVWMCMNYQLFQRFLLQSYDSVLCCDCDELMTINPFGEYKNFKEYYENFNFAVVAPYGFHIVSNPNIDKPIDSNLPILTQRNKWCYDSFFHKPLLSRVPLDYNNGQHTINNIDCAVDQNLILLHLHYIDVDWIVEKNNNRKIEDWSQIDIEHNFTKHNYPSDRETKVNEFLNLYNNSVPIPDFLLHVV